MGLPPGRVFHVPLERADRLADIDGETNVPSRNAHGVGIGGRRLLLPEGEGCERKQPDEGRKGITQGEWTRIVVTDLHCMLKRTP